MNTRIEEQPEALRLAGNLERWGGSVLTEDAATELRRQHARIEALEKQRDELVAALKEITTQHGQWSNGMWVANIARVALANATKEQS